MRNRHSFAVYRDARIGAVRRVAELSTRLTRSNGTSVPDVRPSPTASAVLEGVALCVRRVRVQPPNANTTGVLDNITHSIHPPVQFSRLKIGMPVICPGVAEPAVDKR